MLSVGDAGEHASAAAAGHDGYSEDGKGGEEELAVMIVQAHVSWSQSDPARHGGHRSTSWATTTTPGAVPVRWH